MGKQIDVYQMVTDRMIAALEAGVVPWQRPWVAGAQAPRSISTGKFYEGINTFILGWRAMMAGYTSTYWGTYNAIKQRGGQVRKGEQGEVIVFWKFLRKQDEDAETGKVRTRSIPLLRFFKVFNAEQADGLPATFYTPPVPVNPETAIEDAEVMLGGWLAKEAIPVREANLAAYNPTRDEIMMPAFAQFTSAAGYYGTLAHETVHATGHQSRLNRIDRATFGSDPYAREELVAEMGSAMLLATLGIDGEFDNSAAYVANWLQRLQDDRKLVVVAAGQAMKAAKLVRGEQGAGEEGEAEEAPAAAVAA